MMSADPQCTVLHRVCVGVDTAGIIAALLELYDHLSRPQQRSLEITKLIAINVHT